MSALYWLINTILNLFMWALIISAVMSWLVAFGILNMHNKVVYQIGDFFHRITEPVLTPIRRVLPNLGGVDVSPLVLILLIVFARRLLADVFVAM
ncbi:MAG: YggT family protein [Alphaproteobacteria bacterium]|nr:YggT family protein [Alphaproteobacteria bacterium]